MVREDLLINAIKQAIELKENVKVKVQINDDKRQTNSVIERVNRNNDNYVDANN